MTVPYDKCRLILVPEDSVIPVTQTLIILNGRKGFAGSFNNLKIEFYRKKVNVYRSADIYRS